MEIISSLTSESKHLDASSCCWLHLQSRSILTSHFLQAESQVKGQWDTFPQLSVMCLLEINQKHLLPEKQVGNLCPCGQDGLAVPLQGSSKVVQCEWSPCSELSWESMCQAWPPMPWPQLELSFQTCETALRNAYSSNCSPVNTPLLHLESPPTQNYVSERSTLSWGTQGRWWCPAAPKEEGSTPHPLQVTSSAFNRGELAAFLSSAALLLRSLTPGN